MKTLFKVSLLFIAFLTACQNNNKINHIEVEGTVEGVSVIVSAKTAGDLIAIKKGEGSIVHAGDTVAVLEHKTLSIKLQQARANLQLAQAALELLKNGARIEDVDFAKQKYLQAKASYELAKKEARRIKNLFKKGSATKSKLDKANTQLKISHALFLASKANLKKIKKITRPEQIAQAKARVKAAEASVRLIEKSINDSYLIAPSEGIVAKTFFEKGEFVPIMGSVFEIENLTNPDVYVYIPETKLGLVKPGQKAEIFTDSFPGKKFAGVVATVSPQAEFTPKTIQTKEERVKLVYEVKIKAENPNLELKSGMPVDVKIITK